MKILFLSRWYPFPADNGSKLRIINLIKIAAQRHQVDLISFASEAINEERKAGMLQYCNSVKTILFKEYNPHSLKSRLGYFSTKPRYIFDTYRAEYQDAVRSACLKEKYDLVIASQVDMTPYTKLGNGAKVLVDEIELTIHHEAYANQINPSRRLRSYLTWRKHARYVKAVLKRVDGVSVVSEKELALLSSLSESDCLKVVIPNGIDYDYYQDVLGEPRQDTMIYAGALSYHANLEAVRFFIAEILPFIKEKRPKARLWVTGKINDQIRASLPADPNVEYTGYLEDVRPSVRSSWLSVVPLRVGGGTRLKILESLALGTPVVATSKGAEGLKLIQGKDIVIRDIPEEFACEVVHILESKELRFSLGQTGQKTVGSFYNWKIIGDRFLDFISEIIGKK